MGIVFIAVGIVFLMVSNRILLGWENVWPIFPLGLGALLLRFFRSRRAPWLMFFGTSGLLLGVFLMMFTLGILQWDALDTLWPIFPMIAGVAFLAESAANVDGTPSLIVGSAIILFTAAAFLLETGAVNPRVASPFVRFWPLVLILAGVVMIKARAGSRARVDPDMDAVREVLHSDALDSEPAGIAPGLDRALLDRVRSAADPDAAVAELVHGLKANFPRFSWVGVYRLDEDTLRIGDGDFVGSAPGHREIPLSDGVCGAAVRENRTINVPDVCADPRYLACSPTVKSEVVVPFRHSGAVIGVLDIDSDEADAFSKEDTRFLESLLGRAASFLRRADVSPAAD